MDVKGNDILVLAAGQLCRAKRTRACSLLLTALSCEPDKLKCRKKAQASLKMAKSWNTVLPEALVTEAAKAIQLIR